MQLGCGTFSRVVCSADYPLSAIKETSKEEITYAIKEAALLKSMAHPNVVTLDKFEVSVDGTRLFMHRYPKSLQRRIHEDYFTLQETLRIMYGLSSCLQYIHSLGVIHADVKPGNILLDADGNPVLCDFNISKILTGRYLSGCVQTRQYRAPEVKFKKEATAYSRSIDVWSAGCIFLEMTARYSIVQDGDPDNTTHSVARWLHGESYSTRDEEWESIRPALRSQVRAAVEKCGVDGGVEGGLSNIIAGCLIPDPKRRLSARDLCAEIIDYIEENEVVIVGVPRREQKKNKSVECALNVYVLDDAQVRLLDGCCAFTKTFASELAERITRNVTLSGPPSVHWDDASWVPPALTNRNIWYAVAYVVCCVFEENIDERLRGLIERRDLLWLVERVINNPAFSLPL